MTDAHVPASTVRIIVDNCPANASNREVIRYFVARLLHQHPTWMAIPRDTRRAVMRAIIKRHANNRGLSHLKQTPARPEGGA